MIKDRLFKFTAITTGVIVLCSGCGISNDLQKMIETGQQIEIEIATPISEEQGDPITQLDWIQLDQLKTYPSFRTQLDDIMKISRFGDNSKNGIAYVDLTGNQEGNNTLYNAMLNRKFITNFYENDTANLELQQIINDIYTDVEESEAMVAAINAYWNLAPDATPSYFNGGSTLTRLEAMSLIARASTAVTDEIGNDEFTEAVGQSEFTDLASLIEEYSYLTTADKSLNTTTANSTITRGEYIYMIVCSVFSSDRIASADIQKASFNDCKNGGNIAEREKLPEDLYDNPYLESGELKVALDNPDKGCPEKMFKALTAAQELGIIGSDTRWDEGLTKAEAIQLYLDTLQAYTSENGYPIDQTAGTGDTSGTIVEAEETIESDESDESTNIGGTDFDEDEADTQALINEVTKEVVQEIIEDEGVDTSDTSTDTTDTGDTSTTGNTSTGGTTGTGEVVEDNSYDEGSVDWDDPNGGLADIPEANPGATYGDGTEYHWDIQ